MDNQPQKVEPRRSPQWPWTIVLGIILLAAVLIPVSQSDVDRAGEAGHATGTQFADWLTGNVGTLLGMAALVIAVIAYRAWRHR